MDSPILNIKNFSVSYGNTEAVKKVSLQVVKNEVLAIIGPSGCGKSTLLRSINRMNDLYNVTTAGVIYLHGKNIFDFNPVDLRKRIGMVFQKPNPFPKSIYKNIFWGPNLNGKVKSNLVERSLKQAALWDEVKDKLKCSALELSGGQQQRLCIARAIAMEPEVLLMDEPCSALDPIATAKIEELIKELKQKYTVILVTHNMQQAARISDRTAFMYMGELIEVGETGSMFTNPVEKQTQDYITGRFG